MDDGFVLRGFVYPKNLKENAFPDLPRAATYAISDDKEHKIIALFTNKEIMKDVYNELKEKHPSYSMGLAFGVEIKHIGNE